MKGRDLRQLRINAGIRQTDLRVALKWDKNKLSQIENEVVLPKPEDREAYVAAVQRLSGETHLREEVKST